jgi:Histidine biosynthesis protein
MFEVIPCVDIQNGKAVRLFEGDPNKETVYFESPLEAAQQWASLVSSNGSFLEDEKNIHYEMLLNYMLKNVFESLA